MLLPTGLTYEQLVQVYEWGKQNCLHSNLIQQDDGYIILARRSEEKDLRSRQRLMLTNLRHRGIDTSKQPKGWVKLLTESEYDRFSQRQTPAKRDEVEAAPEQHSWQNPRGCSAEADRFEPSFGLRLPVNLLTRFADVA